MTAAPEVIVTGDGPTEFVYLHGVLGIDAASRAVAALAEHGRVHAPVLPGYGSGPDAPDLRTMLDVTLYMLDAVEALALDDPVLVGHCMGGMIAAEMASVAPNDVGRLALVAPLGLWLDAHPIRDVFAMTPHDIATVIGAPPHAEGDLEDFEHLETVLVRNARQLGMAGKLLFPIPDRGLASRLHRLKADTLLVWGDTDAYVGQPYRKAFADALPNATVTVVPDAGHMLPEEQPAAFAGAIASRFAR